MKKVIGQKIKAILRKKGYVIKPAPVSGEVNRKLIFIHIPKTGGKTMKEFLANQFQSKINVNAPKSKINADLFNLDLQIVRKIIFANYLNSEYNFISGHVAVFPEFWEMKEKSDYSVATMLRNPVNRYFSHYFYNRYKKGDHFRTLKSFDEYLNSDHGKNIGNLMTDFLCGMPKDASLDEKIDSAQKNLERFDHIGVLEQIDEFIKELSPQHLLPAL